MSVMKKLAKMFEDGLSKLQVNPRIFLIFHSLRDNIACLHLICDLERLNNYRGTYVLYRMGLKSCLHQ